MNSSRLNIRFGLGVDGVGETSSECTMVTNDGKKLNEGDLLSVAQDCDG